MVLADADAPPNAVNAEAPAKTQSIHATSPRNENQPLGLRITIPALSPHLRLEYNLES
jgi:hypothetical protein